MLISLYGELILPVKLIALSVHIVECTADEDVDCFPGDGQGFSPFTL